MADNKRQVELQLLFKTEGTKQAVDQIDKLAHEFADIAKQSGSVGSSLRLAVAEAQKFGSTDDDIRRLNSLFNQYRKTVEQTTEETRELVTAQKEAATTVPGGGGNGGLSFGQKVTRAGAQLRNLPSVQIPGAGIGTDAIGNITRLSGALLDVAGKSQLVTTATNLLTPALGAEAAATLGAAAPAAILVVAFGTIAVALSSLTAATGQNAEAITAYAEAQRKLNADIVEGLTSKEAQQKLDALNESRRLEEELLAKNKAAYAAFEAQATEAGTSVDDFGSTLGKIVFGANAVGDVAKAISKDEQAIADNIAASEKNIETFSASADTLTVALESGRLAANDAAEAEKALAEERSKTALAAADNAGKELAARQKALNSTEDQNKARLKSIEEDKAVIQAQIDSLTKSGVTSEDVTAKIAALTDQLGLLGKESAYISETALAASREADAAKKAKKDQEDAEKKATQAQDQYTKSVQSAATTFKQATQDIGTRLKQTLEDNVTKLERDLLNIEKKNNREELELTTKANRAERDAYQDHVNDVRKIQRDSLKDEREALIEGDFKQLYLARVARDEALKEEQETTEAERLQREQSQADAREDLKRNLGYQREDRQLAFEQQNFDARLNRDREAMQARTAQTRALAQASSALNAELGLRQSFWNATLKQAQNAINQINGAGAKASGANANSPFGSFTGPFKAVVRR